ncbi:MAG: 50S ribosomal protein L19 [Spirochaetes bacterium]|nr:50S ribosomal protein L19 [Spirochaetota bacterium]
MDKVSVVSNAQKKQVAAFRPGDTVKVYVKIIEGDRERIQAFEGVVMSFNGSGSGRTFKVRKISYGVGVERTFLLHSPRIDHIDLVRSSKVRRAKLYFLRGKSGKKARLVERLGLKAAAAESAATLKPEEVAVIEQPKEAVAAPAAEKPAEAPKA